MMLARSKDLGTHVARAGSGDMPLRRGRKRRRRKSKVRGRAHPLCARVLGEAKMRATRLQRGKGDR
eukprot:504471-Pleurochrysis_carterae.AAC.1